MKNKKKTILHIISTLERAGTERYLVNLIEGTADKYNNIVLYYYGENKWEQELLAANAKVYKFEETEERKNYKRSNLIREIIKKECVDVVYSYTYYNSAYAMLIAKMSGVKKRITHAHRSCYEKKINRLKILFSRIVISLLSTDRLACSNSAGRSLFLNNFTIINNGIIFSEYKFNRKNREKIRKALNLDNICKVFGIIGHLNKNKNQKFAIDVFKEYHGINQDSKLLIIGDGEELSYLKSTIKDYKLADDVIFLGSVDNIHEYYSALDILFFPSKKEGFPFVLVEAQVNGLPILASDSIDKNAKVNSNFKFLKLSDGPKKWAEEINGDIRRIIPSKRIDKYSVKSTIKQVTDIYNDGGK